MSSMHPRAGKTEHTHRTQAQEPRAARRQASKVCDVRRKLITQPLIRPLLSGPISILEVAFGVRHVVDDLRSQQKNFSKPTAAIVSE